MLMSSVRVCVWRVGVRAAQTGVYLSAHTWAAFGGGRRANLPAKAALPPMWPLPESPRLPENSTLLRRAAVCLLLVTDLQMNTLQRQELQPSFISLFSFSFSCSQSHSFHT